ncbi:MAG: sulfatase [Paludibacteraceae bacterium]|nr:sulfatase [Paludibacteraceae bacterium]
MKLIRALPILASVAAQAQTAEHPNIVFVFPDQMRNAALGLWSEPEYASYVGWQGDPTHTPRLNQFARESVVLSHVQSCCPLSSPYRGMMLTGMYPDGSGITLNCNSTRPLSSLREDARCISDVLTGSGYECAYIGKLHADFPTPNDPEHAGQYVDPRDPHWDAYTPEERRHGFSYWYSYGTYDVHNAPHYWDTEGHFHQVQDYSPRHEVDRALDFLAQRDTLRPFLLMMSMNPPHSPYETTNDCTEQDLRLYADKPIDSLLVRRNINYELTNKLPSAPYYFANVTGVDREFGRLLDALDSLHLSQNTIVVFTSDHGETMCSHVWDPKNSPYDESMNVPFIIRYPDKLRPRVDNLLLTSPDIMPTLLGLAGLQDSIPGSVQGSNLARQLAGSRKDRPQGVLYIRNMDGTKDADGIVQDYFAESRGIRTDRYTLVFSLKRDGSLKKTWLFDNKRDPYQNTNLPISDHQRLVRRLCQQMLPLLQQADDPWIRQHTFQKLMNSLHINIQY